jgi:hypothetical protein
MNISRKLLRIWLTISSVIGFVAGWIFLSHTADTTQQVDNTIIQMPEIQAIPPLGTQSSSVNNIQTFAVNPNITQQSSLPIFRTGGS